MRAVSARFQNPISLPLIVVVALLVHGPLLLMQLPAGSFDCSLHIFFASHYAHHWFQPWNEKWFAGFSQTTYPPLTHQWIALLSNVVGLSMGYMLVQLAALLLLTAGVYRFARLWVNERAASYAGLGSIFLGIVALMVYEAGQLPTITATALYLNALPYLYEWLLRGKRWSLVRAVAITVAAAAAHHASLIFGLVFFALPILILAVIDRRQEGTVRSVGGIAARVAAFAALASLGIAVVLLPYWIAIVRHPIQQIPIPHDSRSNFLLNPVAGVNNFIIPYGALILALPSIIVVGMSSKRLRPLALSFWLALIFGLGGTTPLPRWLLGRAFEILTFERFALWAALLCLPLAGLLVARWLDRSTRIAAAGVSLAMVGTFVAAMAWVAINPYRPGSVLNVPAAASFLNSPSHNSYRYLTLGFGNSFAKLSRYTNADSIDGDYNSARLLPEMTHYGSAQLTSAKFYGTAGMESLRAILKHAKRYGLKYVVVHDPYYEPLLTFGGWRQIEKDGDISIWSTTDMPTAAKLESDAVPAVWEGWMWGTLPIASSILFIVLELTGRKSGPLRKADRSSERPIAQRQIA